MNNKVDNNNFINKRGKVRDAMHWRAYKNGRTECTLCPRYCKIRNNKTGTCRVRGPIDGVLKTFNYGLALMATEENIETEAINHYRPGARILSLGNLGCMMHCSFCQNWKTSQVKFLDHRVIEEYSPQEIITICIENHIEIISWTYNDPVVWHEFVLETSRLAQAKGIKTLYKSAFYIGEEPVNELIECIDIFSISLKSMSERFYRRITKAKLQPVLDRIIQVSQSGRHLEISQLIVPELNDNDEDIEQTIFWIKNNLGMDVPLHFVAFHPAYKYIQVERTSIKTLERARKLAIASGIKHVYLGNVNKTGVNDTLCTGCGAMLVSRYGLRASVKNINDAGVCEQCGSQSTVIEPHYKNKADANIVTDIELNHKQIIFQWKKTVQAIHVVRSGNQNSRDILQIQSLGDEKSFAKVLRAGLDRFIVSRTSEKEKGIIIRWDSDNDYSILPVLDRAHFPVLPDQSLAVPTSEIEIKVS